MAGCHWTGLNGVRLPDGGPVLRDYTRDEALHDDNYRQTYDRLTLFYHAFLRQDRRQITVVAPPFLNLWPQFRDTLSLDGVPLRRVSRRQTRHCDIVTIRLAEAAGPGAVLSGAGWQCPLPEADLERFKNRNVLVAINKNNDLAWIADWARYHVNAHGADAVLLIDNASDAYGQAALQQTLSNLRGIKAAGVFAAPFPYGPRTGKIRRGERPAKFLQTAMLNLGHLHSLAHARAVLSIDIDEAVRRPEDESVFDAACRHPLGLVTLRGSWAMPAPDHSGEARHADHCYRMREPGRGNRKWCVKPSGLIGRHWPWHVHQMGGALQNWFTETPRFAFAHCWAISTGWKRTDRLAHGKEVVWDQALADQWARHLP